jgi:hypothetical protein
MIRDRNSIPSPSLSAQKKAIETRPFEFESCAAATLEVVAAEADGGGICGDFDFKLPTARRSPGEGQTW